MPTLSVTMPRLHLAQQAVWNHPARFQVLATGRRFGKSRLGALRCVFTGASGKRAWWVAPSFPMASIGWRMVKALAKQLPGVTIRESDRMITFPGGGWVQVKSADNPDSLRGEGLDFLVIDECAFVREEAWTEALRPALSDRQGRAYLISTPKGRNWFWRAWAKGQDGNEEEWHSWQLPTSANPYIVPDEIEAARGGLPERVFLQEYEAQFLDDAGGVFRRVMDAATAVEISEAIPGHDYVMGVDLARVNDFTVLIVLDISVTPAEMVYMDRFNKVDWSFQVQRIITAVRRFNVNHVLVDQTGVGDPIVEQLQRELY